MKNQINQTTTENTFSAISDWMHTAVAAIPENSPFLKGCSMNMSAADELLLKLEAEHAALLVVEEASKETVELCAAGVAKFGKGVEPTALKSALANLAAIRNQK